MHICISILPRSVGKRNRGWKNSIDGVEQYIYIHTYVGARQAGGVGPNRDRGICDYCILLIYSLYEVQFIFTYLGNQLSQSLFKTLVVSFRLSQNTQE